MDMVWPGGAVSRNALEDRDPLTYPSVETIDSSAGVPDVVAWKREARARQVAWRELHGWPAGLNDSLPSRKMPVGSYLDRALAEEHGLNFLTPAAWHAARARLAQPERGQTLGEGRLYADLLSSMPLAFNLFGPLWESPALAERLARSWFGPELVPDGSIVAVRFEWSPGRVDIRFTGDRTAADAALLVDTGSARHLIAIETKYHEHVDLRSAEERRSSKTRRPEKAAKAPSAHAALADQRRRALTTLHHLFDEEAAAKARAAPLEQVWRDHLLALSCLRTSATTDEDAKSMARVDRVAYVLVAPSENPVWGELAERYTHALRPEARSTFMYRSIEDLVDAGGAAFHWSGAIRARYLTSST